MFDADWQNQLYTESGSIVDSNIFQEILLEKFQAHGCSITYTQSNKTSFSLGRFNHFKSYLTQADLIKYLKAIGRKKNFHSLIRKCQILSPSELWKEIGINFSDQVKSLRAIVVGVDKNLFAELTKYQCLTLVKWTERQILNPPDIQKEICTYTISRQEFYGEEEELFDSEINEESCSLWMQFHDLPKQLTEKIKDTAEHHIFGALPCSFISIGIPIRGRPDEKIDFFSIQIFWCGIPIQSKATKIIELIAFVNDVASRIIFPSDINNAFDWLRHLAQLALARQSQVHKYDEWLLNCSVFLQKYAYELYSVNAQLCPKRVDAAKNFHFYFGLKKISGLCDSTTKSNFDLDTFFTISQLHLFMRPDTKVTVNTTRENKADILDITVDYKKWSLFLSFFDEGEKEHGDKIEYIELQNDRLNIFVSQIGTLKCLMRKIYNICHNPDISNHQAAGSFYETFLKLNPYTINNSEVEFDYIFINLKSDTFTAQLGNLSEAYLIIEIDDFHKCISLIVADK